MLSDFNSSATRVVNTANGGTADMILSVFNKRYTGMGMLCFSMLWNEQATCKQQKLKTAGKHFSAINTYNDSSRMTAALVDI